MGKRLIVKGADFSTNGITAYKFVLVTTNQVKTSYTNKKLNLYNIIDISTITANTEYFIKVTSNGNKFKDVTLALIIHKNSTYETLSQFHIGDYDPFKVENIPDSFILQTIEDIDNNVAGDDTLTIDIYQKQEFI
jgi:hypothetical protein